MVARFSVHFFRGKTVSKLAKKSIIEKMFGDLKHCIHTYIHEMFQHLIL